MAITGIFFGSDTGNTENIAKMIQKLTEARRSGLLRQKNLFILCALEGSNDFSFSSFSVIPAFNFNPLTFFEVFAIHLRDELSLLELACVSSC